MQLPAANEGAAQQPGHKYLPDDVITSAMEWDPDRYGVGLRNIDEQHKLLVTIINGIALRFKVVLEQKVMGGSKLLGKKKPSTTSFRNFEPRLQLGARICEDVDQLIGWAGKYLAQEDIMLDNYGVPDRVAHSKDHELFVLEVCRIHKLTEEYNAQEDDFRRLLTFLWQWMTGHIARDRLYAPMLLERGVGS